MESGLTKYNRNKTRVIPTLPNHNQQNQLGRPDKINLIIK